MCSIVCYIQIYLHSLHTLAFSNGIQTITVAFFALCVLFCYLQESELNLPLNPFCELLLIMEMGKNDLFVMILIQIDYVQKHCLFQTIFLSFVPLNFLLNLPCHNPLCLSFPFFFFLQGKCIAKIKDSGCLCGREDSTMETKNFLIFPAVLC